jgi:hypothetical protein
VFRLGGRDRHCPSEQTSQGFDPVRHGLGERPLFAQRRRLESDILRTYRTAAPDASYGAGERTLIHLIFAPHNLLILLAFIGCAKIFLFERGPHLTVMQAKFAPHRSVLSTSSLDA